MTELASNVLYYGDNLAILRRYLPDAAIDLVYLDPPFNSNRDDNVIFRDASDNATDAKLLGFEDTWHWGKYRWRTWLRAREPRWLYDLWLYRAAPDIFVIGNA